MPETSKSLDSLILLTAADKQFSAVEKSRSLLSLKLCVSEGKLQQKLTSTVRISSIQTKNLRSQKTLVVFKSYNVFPNDPNESIWGKKKK